jgi:hypothetical protein
LYPRLRAELRDAGITYLQQQGIEVTALTGHSVSRAVIIQAAVRSPAVRTVLTLATQCYRVEPVAQLAPRCSILPRHDTADGVLPAARTDAAALHFWSLPHTEP